MTLSEALRTKQLVVMLGTGGVGKTTISAAAALEASRDRRTLVLTVDPARRLADSLGVKLGSEIVHVRPNLDALMLDTKAALDALVRRYAPSADTLGRIFGSRFYEQLSDAFAGSEEFVAMGTLHDLVADGSYDVIVVDTPPSSHAIEFLRVNKKLIRVYESGVVKYLFKPTRFLRLGGGYMMNVLSRWTSSEYIEEMAEFMSTFDQMFADMETRVRAIERVLADPARTSLHIVSTAEEESVPQTARLYREVTGGLGLPIASCIVNRHYPRLKGLEVARALGDPAYHAGAVRRVTHATGAAPDAAARFIEDAVRAGLFYEALAADHEKYEAALRAQVPAPFDVVPAMPGSVHDLAGLERVRAALFDA
ncbi:MAG TPA: ArsA-related P-loop ATPase [Candidatus Thermoplasmatota archaeon]|nr:ArsA-related P-loop ATPase [Candidatus Thermoplasmatota archaeon]